MQPFYKSGKITKDEYKDIMRKAVPAVRHFVLVLCTFNLDVPFDVCIQVHGSPLCDSHLSLL